MIDEGDYSLEAHVYNQASELILDGLIPVTVPLPPDHVLSSEHDKPQIIRLSKNTFKIKFTTPSRRIVTVYSIDGKFLGSQTIYDKDGYLRINESGIYIVRVHEDANLFSFKIII